MKYLKYFENNEDILIKAIKWENFQKVKDLVNSDNINYQLSTSPNNYQEGWTPLMFAAQQGNLEIVKFLIDCGADLNIQTIFGYTALMIASLNKSYFNVVLSLIKSGAEWNIYYDKKKSGKTFLDFLSLKQRQTVIKMFPDKYEEYLIKKDAELYNM